MESLYETLTFKQERTVDLGPFKHKVEKELIDVHYQLSTCVMILFLQCCNACRRASVYAFMRKYVRMQAYIHPYVHIYIHTYIHAYIAHTCVYVHIDVNFCYFPDHFLTSSNTDQSI